MKLQTIIELLERHSGENIDFAQSYGEPGYADPKAGILFTNWNNVPRFIARGLERRGFELEWSDEWVVSYETSKAYRSSPDSYSWTPSYVMTEDGDIIGADEVFRNADRRDWYINEFLANNPGRANIFHFIKFDELGWTQYNDRYETGFHHGQDDDPRKVFEKIRAEFPDDDVVFDLVDKGQFDVHWLAWHRNANEPWDTDAGMVEDEGQEKERLYDRLAQKD